MKNSTLKSILFILTLNCLSANYFAQTTTGESKGILNRPLKNINYMSVNLRYGMGLGQPKMAVNNDWKVNPGPVFMFGLGYDFMIKNNWGFDIQISDDIASHEVSGMGASFKTGYSAIGCELGIKKTLYKKADDTFFIRGAFGYNFLIKSDNSSTNDFYTYSSSANGSSMYVLPELGYQLRLAEGKHILDFSICYKYSLSEVANTSVLFTDKGNTAVANNVNMTGNYLGVIFRYSLLFKGFEDNKKPNIKVDSHF